MSYQSTQTRNAYGENELDKAIADAMEQFTDCKIRIRSPNRNVRSKHLKKISKESYNE